jgi:MFS superfamily sulfate permease-like transporter
VAAVVTALVVVLTLPFLTALFDAATPRPDVLVVDFSAVSDIDTALDELPAFDANARERGITLWMANINARPLDMIRRRPDADRVVVAAHSRRRRRRRCVHSENASRGRGRSEESHP